MYNVTTTTELLQQQQHMYRISTATNRIRVVTIIKCCHNHNNYHIFYLIRFVD
jgi:hypothetical protein